jgi:hypothetical protein
MNMAVFTLNTFMTAFVQPFSLTAAAVNPSGTISANMVAPTGQTCYQEAFGVAGDANYDDFGTMNTSQWQASYNAVGGFKCFRLMPSFRNLGQSPAWGSSTTPPSSAPDLDPAISALITMKYAGRVIICLGQSSTYANQFYNLAYQVSTYIQAKFTAAGVTNPITYYEGLNENGDNTTQGPAMRQGLNDAGFSSYWVLGPVCQFNVTQPGQSTTMQSYLTNFANAMKSYSNVGFSAHYYAGINFGNTSGNGASSTTGQINTCVALSPDGSSATYAGDITKIRSFTPSSQTYPIAITEYNMNGAPSKYEESENNNGAVYAALATLNGVSQTSVEMMTWWEFYQAHPGGDTYGLINGNNSGYFGSAPQNVTTTWNSGTNSTDGGTAVSAYAIFPAAWVLGRLGNYMSGNVVSTAVGTSIVNVYAVATATTAGAFRCLCMVNYGTAQATVTVSISTNPSTVTYFRVDASNPAPPYNSGSTPVITTGYAASNFSALVLPPRSVTILTP